ncbi:hypothetical protein LJC42_08310 [Eubacteriales bacterium OttesenSCG-928-K08]|nr:hypothetical protein [Eubacteriales bacterium OttesenSCG-928-K08]
MAFIRQKISESEKEFLESLKILAPLTGKGTLARIPDYWIADYDRNLFLIGLGGQGYRYSNEYPPDYFKLIWDNKVIGIEAQYTHKRNIDVSGTVSVDVKWKILNIFAPATLLHISREEIKDTAIGAFKEYSNYYYNDRVRTLEFVSVAEPYFARGY